ncbi:peptidylprolyl isomerase [Porticoccus sp. W117]|uniref:peptidylprolyl isomerase n=1 Tax=Porticoccus sp. W117 TaxID=3054777 RepID=UPI002596C4DA|nr:peptidylprolyl isomerase [Porticoccus sp. W117]MDM3871211.1 peptidylprolyl isomerase [Porticoccus sp. W117]
MTKTLAGIVAAAFTLFAFADTDKHLTTAEVMASLKPSDWREPDTANLLYMQTRSGEIIIELAPGFAPKHIANIRTMVKERYFDGLAVIRSHDNYVAQWGDPNFEDADKAKSLGTAKTPLKAEIFQPLSDNNITPIESRDAYADHVGFSEGFPVGHDDTQLWMLHCYGTVGVGRGMDIDSGDGSSLYAVTGHAPRHLDKNLTVVGRVIWGMEHLSSLPRGTGNLGFYETAAEHEPLLSVRLGSELSDKDRTRLRVLRTDTPAFQRWVQSCRYRNHEFFHDPTGRIGIGNIIPPVEKL